MNITTVSIREKKSSVWRKDKKPQRTLLAVIGRFESAQEFHRELTNALRDDGETYDRRTIRFHDGITLPIVSTPMPSQKDKKAWIVSLEYGAEALLGLED